MKKPKKTDPIRRTIRRGDIVQSLSALGQSTWYDAYTIASASDVVKFDREVIRKPGRIRVVRLIFDDGTPYPGPRGDTK